MVVVHILFIYLLALFFFKYSNYFPTNITKINKQLLRLRMTKNKEILQKDGRIENLRIRETMYWNDFFFFFATILKRNIVGN